MKLYRCTRHKLDQLVGVGWGKVQTEYMFFMRCNKLSSLTVYSTLR